MRSEIKRFGRGFVYAWNGIRAAVQQERNFRFHLCATCYTIAACCLAEVSAVEWALIILCIAAVLGMELMNSAIERAVDKPDTTHWWSAGAAKDMAAGAVLIVALGALCIGCVLLIPRLSVIVDHLRTVPVTGVLCLLGLIPAYLFTLRYHQTNQKGETTNGKSNS